MRSTVSVDYVVVLVSRQASYVELYNTRCEHIIALTAQKGLALFCPLEIPRDAVGRRCNDFNTHSKPRGPYRGIKWSGTVSVRAKISCKSDLKHPRRCLRLRLSQAAASRIVSRSRRGGRRFAARSRLANLIERLALLYDGLARARKIYR